MKLKKEYLIILLVILGLSVYIYTRTSDRIQYALPEIHPVQSSRLTRIVIEKPEARIELHKNESGWVAGKRKYPVRPASIENLMASLNDLSLTDLVSQSENYARYGLDSNSAIQVTAWDGKERLRSFQVGKAASTFRNAYVKLREDPNIYLAAGNLKSTFDKNLEDFQDTTVLSFQQKQLREITLRAAGRSRTLRRTGKTDRAEEPSSPAEQPGTWQTDDGLEPDSSRVQDLLQSLADLQCSAYLEDREKADFTDPDYQILLQGAHKSGLSLFVKDQENKATEYRGTSLENDFPFRLSENKGDTILKALQNLLDQADSKEL